MPVLHLLRRRRLLTVPMLVAAVVLLAVLCAFNGVLTLGIVRRLREPRHEHTAAVLAAGSAVADFTTSTVDGAELARDTLGPALLGFFAPGCGPCDDELPAFLATAAGYPRVIAVVSDPDDDAAAPLVAELRDRVTVVREDDLGPVQRAFGVGEYPVFAVVDHEGVVAASGARVAGLPTFVAR